MFRNLAIVAVLALEPTTATAQVMMGPLVSQEVADQLWPSESVYLECNAHAAISLALDSNDPAQTIVDAAQGLCLKEADALRKRGDELNTYEDMVSFVDTNYRGQLVLVVIRARAGDTQPHY
jgi:hypothetical protein